MRIFLTLLFIACCCFEVKPQEEFLVRGRVLDVSSEAILRGVLVIVEGTDVSDMTSASGLFELEAIPKGSHMLHISLLDYTSKRIPIEITNKTLDLGTIYLERDITLEKTDNLITLTDSELLDDEINSVSSAFLQATRDVFLNRAAFDFGQAFFRVRGYDSQNGRVFINGIVMNKFFDGRPQWNNWGGLNDVMRNQQYSHGLAASDFAFGGILGNTNIDTKPSGFRPGIRISSSASNRTYTGRVMATYNSGLQKNRLAYSLSGSRRWAKQGYIDGTLYDAYSFFGAMEYRLNKKNSVHFTGILASNRRGRSSAITEEVFEMAGKKYNPYWGNQDGKTRNSRERKIVEPIVMLNHYYESEAFTLSTGIAYQVGKNARSRLGYYNAPNPDPTYYRYLPSFYINSPIGANFASAETAREGFLTRPQMNWEEIYVANTSEKAAYVLYDDIADDSSYTINSVAKLELGSNFETDFGLTYKRLHSEKYAKIFDLLGASFHEDIDPFSNTLNDSNGSVRKGQDDTFNYNYLLEAVNFEGFAQLRFAHNKWNAFLSGKISNSSYQRTGYFLNDRFPSNSLGKSEKVTFSNFGFKLGYTYNFNGRHSISAHGAYLTRPPVLQNSFINPRENNQTVPQLQSETVSTIDGNYFIRLPSLTGRLSAFYTRFQNTTDVNFFFVDAGVGSDFVQEVLTDFDKLHLGTELGLEYQVSPSVKLNAVAAIGKYVYANDPKVSINFDTAGADEDLINPEGNVDLGRARIKDYKLGQGPQKAFAFGVEYRDPKYWWIGVTANYLANSYTNISTITRTQSFYLDPESGQPFPDATEENVNKLLQQKPLDDFYLLNLVGGKSWLKKGKYFSLFISINNLFDATFRTGGYEQSRNGNFGQMQQDNLSGTPSFAPKYWYGYGRTYFLNVAYSF